MRVIDGMIFAVGCLGLVATDVAVAADARKQLTREQIHAKAVVTETWKPVPPMVKPGQADAAPDDAIVLFDGDGLDRWRTKNNEAAGWTVTKDYFEVKPGQSNIYTREKFGDVQLHIEWAAPGTVVGDSQGRGNSGVFFMDRYEVQILDSFNNPTYPNGQAGSVYKQHIPLVNASRAPGEWQSYDILFTAPRFSDNGRVSHPAYVTVLHNGVLIQNHVAIQGPTEYVGKPQYEPHSEDSIRLQDHSNPVRFRNIWARRL